MSGSNVRGSATPTCAYIVISHSLPEQTERLLRAIRSSSPTSAVVVMHDGRESPPPRALATRCLVVEHGLATDWGSWEIVEAMLEGCRIARREFGTDIYAIVSGQDYPVVDLAAWECRFGAVGGWQGSAQPVTYRPRWGRRYGEGNDNFTRFHYRWYPLPGGQVLDASGSSWARGVRWALWKVGHYFEPIIDVRHVTRGRGFHIGFRAVRGPLGRSVRCMLGSQWLAMDRARLVGLLQRHESDRRLRRQFERSIIPDEAYFQTLLSDQCPQQQAPPVSHVKWSPDTDGAGTLTLDDLDEILAGGSPFCRKVALPESGDLMDLLDVRRGAVT